MARKSHLRRVVQWVSLLVLGSLVAVGCSHSQQGANHSGQNQLSPHQVKTKKTLAAFATEAELKEHFKSQKEKAAKQGFRYGANGGYTLDSAPMVETQTIPSPPAQATAAKADGESITNTQHAGVDEGGIVKNHGDHLIILRRGRLFSVNIANGAMRTESSINAFSPDIDPSETWYDEMLVSGNTIAVIGYSYQRGGTEIGLFNIDSEGLITYRSTYHLRSNDYYSSRNYASRLVGDKLIFYTPMYLNLSSDSPEQNLPALRKWHKGALESEFKSIVKATHIYRTQSDTLSQALHTVTVCDLAKPDMKCEATGILGPASRVFYVSPSSVYVWVTDWTSRYAENRDKNKTPSYLYRMPLDGSAPSALAVSGSPIDQFSFNEGSDGHLNVVVRANAGGEAMWASEASSGDMALLRLPTSDFADTDESAPKSAYRALPKIEGYTVQNRFVGNYLYYGAGNSWGAAAEKARTTAYAVQYTKGDVTPLSLSHGVDRIEALGSDALIVGSDGKNLHFSPVSTQAGVVVKPDFVKSNASQGELRSHGFFYKPEGADTGWVGLPIREAGKAGADHIYRESASVIFVRNNQLSLSEAGGLSSNADAQINDACQASCVDWYGNSRPIFAKR